MITIYKTNDKSDLLQLNKIEENVWVNLVDPTDDEINEVVDITGIDKQLVIKVLDDEETPRIETNGDATLIIVDTPFVEDRRHRNKYTTVPLGIIISTNNYIVTVSLKECEVLGDFSANKVKNFFTSKKTRFTIQLLTKIASSYQKYLKIISEDIDSKEKVLYKSTSNKELISILNTEKSLVYFITALKANDVILNKLVKGNTIPLFQDDTDLLDDAIIENQQGIEMANIYREILSSMSDIYGTIISNNLNLIMKFLAGITIIFSVPTMIASFFGMNVPLGILNKNDVSFPIIIVMSLIISLIIAWFLKKKDML